MANPQIKNGHLDIANDIVDKLCSYHLNGQEWQIIWVILRKTWCWLENPNDKKSPKKKMEMITLSQFALLTGIERCQCQKILKRLTQKRIIIKRVVQKYNTPQISYGFQKDYDQWEVLCKSTTVVQKYNKVLYKSTTLPIKDTLKDIKTSCRNMCIKNQCPYQKILDLYHKILPELPQVRVYTPKRKGIVNARWKQNVLDPEGKTTSGQIEFWENLFFYISKLDFLMGRTEQHGNIKDGKLISTS